MLKPAIEIHSRVRGIGSAVALLQQPRQCRFRIFRNDDGERISRAVKQVEGKRLMYRESVDNPPYLVLPLQPEAPFGQ